jgi:hypothetical protein
MCYSKLAYPISNYNSHGKVNTARRKLSEYFKFERQTTVVSDKNKIIWNAHMIICRICL